MDTEPKQVDACRATPSSPAETLDNPLVAHTCGHSGSVRGGVTPGGRQAISASEDHTLKVWDLRTGVVVRTLDGHTSGVTGVALTSDGKVAVSASHDHTQVWRLGSHALEGCGAANATKVLPPQDL